MFNSFDEADRADAARDAALTPHERIQIVLELRERCYPNAASERFGPFVELLNSSAVAYLVVGAFAVAHHGYPRFTADLDLLIRPTPGNAERVLRTLSQFGFGKLAIGAGDLQTEGKIVQLGVNPNRIDLITSLSGVTFEEAWESRVQSELGGIPAQFIGVSALLRNKEATGRAKDLGDAEELRKRIPRR